MKKNKVVKPRRMAAPVTCPGGFNLDCEALRISLSFKLSICVPALTE